MNCIQCGQPLAPGLKFCDKCGTKVGQSPTQIASPVMPTATPAQPTNAQMVQPSSNTMILKAIEKNAKLTAIFAMVVSALNLLILLLLALFADKIESTEKIEINWVVIGIQSGLLVVLAVFGLNLYKNISQVPKVKTLIRFRIFPIMGLLVAIGLISGGGGIGILPLLILIFGVQTVQKINEYEKSSIK